MFENSSTAETDQDAARDLRPGVRPPWYLGALSGLLAGTLAVGVGLLTAQWFHTSSPTDAVGSSFIDRVPGWLKTLAIDWFGTNDKRALRVGIFAVMGILALLLGWRALRNRWVGIAGFIAFGLFGELCVVDRPHASVSSTFPTALAVVSGAGSLALLLSALVGDWRGRNYPRVSRVPLGMDRRRFVATTGCVALGAVATGSLGAALERRRVSRLEGSAPGRLPRLVSTSTSVVGSETSSGPTTTTGHDAPGASGLAELEKETPFITPSGDFYRIDTAVSFPNVSIGDWKLHIHGLVDRPITLTYDEILKRPQVERMVTLACVSNEVGGHLVGNAVWQGVLLADLLEEAGVRKEAEQVYTTSADGWTCGFPVQAVFDGRDALLAIGMNGKALPIEHGLPARLVVPGLYGYVSGTKWITDINLTTWDDRAGYWISRGWARLGPIKPQSRIDVPRKGSGLTAGPVVLGGVAWAQRHGVALVEVQVDDGPWVQATLDDRDNIDAWRQWHLVWDATKGKHKVRARVTDRTGASQTEQVRPPDPDGATGYHTRKFSVR